VSRQARELDRQKKDGLNQQKVQQQAQRKAAPQVQGERVGHPTKSAAPARAEGQGARPPATRTAAAPKMSKQAAKPQSQGAPKQARKPEPASAAPAKGKGKDKHP